VPFAVSYVTSDVHPHTILWDYGKNNSTHSTIMALLQQFVHTDRREGGRQAGRQGER